MNLNATLNANVCNFYSKACAMISLKWKYGLISYYDALAERRAVLKRLGWKRVKRNPYWKVSRV